jgi:hypothetical protein
VRNTVLPSARALDHVPCAPAGGRVEAGGGLVQEQQLRVADQGEGDVETAPLPAGEKLARRAGAPLQPDQRDRVVDVPGLAVVAGVELEALADREARLGLRLLRDHADAVAPGPAGVGRVLAEDRDLAGGAGTEPSRISTVVVLPAPLGPRKAKISPRRTSRASPRTASTSSCARPSRT